MKTVNSDEGSEIELACVQNDSRGEKYYEMNQCISQCHHWVKECRGNEQYRNEVCLYLENRSQHSHPDLIHGENKG